MNYRYKTLFLKQSYGQALSDYENALGDNATSPPAWDHVVLTASSEEQADGFRAQLDRRLRSGMLPRGTKYTVVPDPDGKRIGSGGATLNALRVIAREHAADNVGDDLASVANTLKDMRILCIHSGGDSKRAPQYSVCGKLFSPIPRLLPNGLSSTLFDEIMMTALPVAARMRDGMLVCSGDVLLLFDPLQLDLFTEGAAALSVKAAAELGARHGVYRSDGKGFVGSFLHKKPLCELEKAGAIDSDGCIDIDTGAVLLDGRLTSSLCSLALSDTENELINERVRLSFYADISYPMSADATLEKYLLETPENTYSDELTSARKRLWELLSPIRMKLISFSPARFLHFGTTAELLGFMTDELEEYECLGWHPHVGVYTESELPPRLVAVNSHIGRDLKAEGNCYIENSIISDGVCIGSNCIVSGARVPKGARIPDGAVIHCVALKSGRWVARAYGVNDDPKLPYHFGKRLDRPLWSAELFPLRSTPEEAFCATLQAFRDGFDQAFANEGELISLERSFSDADGGATLSHNETLSERIATERYLARIKKGDAFSSINAELPETADIARTERIVSRVTELADAISPSNISELVFKEKIYYCLSFRSRINTDAMREKAFGAVADTVNRHAPRLAPPHPGIGAKRNVCLHLPLRVNFGGGWTDTPPYCLEKGGCVLNAAIALDGKLPVTVRAELLDERKLVLASEDKSAVLTFSEAAHRGLCSLTSPGDPISIHKAALAVCGLLPFCPEGKGEMSDGTGTPDALGDLFDRLGGGILLTTKVNVPEGSGLGTSSILAAGCVRALCELLTVPLSSDELWRCVLSMEQMISTGGGWQDQIGGLTKGIKLVTSIPGIVQEPRTKQLTLDTETLKELEERYAVIYTGQRRLSRSLVREVMGRYIAAETDALEILKDIGELATRMKDALEKGDIDGFAALLNEHWRLLKALDPESTNECIEAIFDAIAPLISGRMICGAGGGGYLQVILKRGVDRTRLDDCLRLAFGDGDIRASRCTFIL